ncbi:hypothetical protein IEQ34_018865 [Dendrobium chrysotoxum]|uniref:RING-type domain-containing protein n=1 Tax=Dendrobium chrysotoxum TaxID=161865 RepID=A0AAV7G5V1_DENCH|nr:hypothetical protein IEQ34_018865 [Dendrobium chrysotoxum]
MNCFVRRNNAVGSSGYWLPEANYQQQVLMPMVPLSMVMNAAASAAAAADFHVNEHTSYLDSAYSMASNVAEKNQTEEFDRFLLMQIEQLKSTLQQQWKQQLSYMAVNLEAKFIKLLMQKDKDLAEEKKGAMRLVKFLQKALSEKEKWEKVARKLYSMASALNQTLQQVQKPCFSSTGREINREEERASCFRSPKEEEEVDDDEPSAKRRKVINCQGSSSLCQICSSSSACLLILPCRHLCLCKQCEALHCRCPVCKCVKKETIEVLFS